MVYRIIEKLNAKAIYSEKFLWQKIDYIHNNPVKGKWHLAKDTISYEHSSASFYETSCSKHFTRDIFAMLDCIRCK